MSGAADIYMYACLYIFIHMFVSQICTYIHVRVRMYVFTCIYNAEENTPKACHRAGAADVQTKSLANALAHRWGLSQCKPQGGAAAEKSADATPAVPAHARWTPPPPPPRPTAWASFRQANRQNCLPQTHLLPTKAQSHRNTTPPADRGGKLCSFWTRLRQRHRLAPPLVLNTLHPTVPTV